MNEDQKKFFQHIGMLQESAVQIALSDYKEGDDVENLLYDTTFGLIVELMTMIDGYGSFGDEKMDIVNRKTGVCMKESPFIELHDRVCEYIKYVK